MSEQGKAGRERPPSKRWATLKEVATHFCVSEATVRLGRGVFARLRRAQLGGRRTVIPRADVERLDRELERAAVALAPDVVRLDERRKTA